MTIGMHEMVNTVIRSGEGPEGKRECAYLRPRGINSQGKIFLALHLLKRLYFGCFRGDLDKFLKIHRKMMEVTLCPSVRKE